MERKGTWAKLSRTVSFPPQTNQGHLTQRKSLDFHLGLRIRYSDSMGSSLASFMSEPPSLEFGILQSHACWFLHCSWEEKPWVHKERFTHCSQSVLLKFQILKAKIISPSTSVTEKRKSNTNIQKSSPFQAWWHIPFILALKRQKQAGL